MKNAGKFVVNHDPVQFTFNAVEWHNQSLPVFSNSDPHCQEHIEK